MFKLNALVSALSVFSVLSLLNNVFLVSGALWKHPSRSQFRNGKSTANGLLSSASTISSTRSGATSQVIGTQPFRVRICNDESSPLRTPRDYYLDTSSSITMGEYELPNQNWNHNAHPSNNHNQIVLHNASPQNTNGNNNNNHAPSSSSYHRFPNRHHSYTNAHQSFHHNQNQQNVHPTMLRQQQQQWPSNIQTMNFDDKDSYELIQNFNDIDFFKNDQFYKQNPSSNKNHQNYQKQAQQKPSETQQQQQHQQQQQQQQRPFTYGANNHNKNSANNNNRNYNNNQNNHRNYQNYNNHKRQNRPKISAAAKYPTQYSHDYIPFEPIPEPPPEPQIIEVTGDVVPIIVNFKSLSSPVQLLQNHQMSKVTEPEETRSEDEPQILKHQVLKPIIQIVKEIITPYRKVIQEVRPVEEVIHTVISRKKKKPEQKPNYDFRVSDFGKYVPDNKRNSHKAMDSDDMPDVFYREVKNTNSDIKLHRMKDDYYGESYHDSKRHKHYDDIQDKPSVHSNGHFNGQNSKVLEKSLENHGGIVTYVSNSDSIDKSDKAEQITDSSSNGSIENVNNEIVGGGGGATAKDNNYNNGGSGVSTESVESTPTEVYTILNNHHPTESGSTQAVAKDSSETTELTSAIAEDS